MALTSPSKTVAAFDKGRLSRGISASATTIYVSAIFKTVDGVRTKQGFNSTAGECLITLGDYTERISFEGSSVDSTTKETTLTTCTRGLPVTNTTANFTGGTGRIWPKGAYISVVDAASYNQSGVYTNTTNTFTAAQTFNAAVGIAAPLTISGTTSYVKLPELNQAQEDALTPSEGMLIKNSTTNTIRQYTGGAWASVGTDATANGSTTVAGKYEEATVAEQGSATATGGTGARLVPAVANLVKTSSGAGDENKLAVLNSSGTYNIGFLATGTPTGTKFIRDDNTLQTIPSTYYGTGVDGALSVTSGTTTLDFAGASFLIKEYSSISISSGATLAVSNVSSSGGLLVLLCSGNVTIAGTIDLSGKGSSGGSAVSNTISGATNSLINGAAGTTVFNTFQQLRVGGAGNGASSGGTNAVAASGGGGGSNVATAGTASSVATSGAASAAASTASVAITTSILTLAASARCLTVGPGAGGGSGGHGWEVDTYTSGSSTFLSGAGGTGGGGLYIACKGNYTDAGGTINLSASNGGTASNSGTLSATNYAIASGGGGGGAGGTGIAVVGGTITATGTYTVTGGSGGVGETLTNGGHGAAKSDGGAGAAGLYIVTYAS